MADILRVTTPLVNKSQQVETKPNIDPAVQFPVQDTTRVNRPGPQSELLQQNNGMVQQDETSAMLLNLLKDPSVTVNFLKSISSMEALIKLLPVNNSPFTKEIEQMFGELLVPSDDIAAEMGRQENASTYFKGELFELLRDALRQNPEQGELRDAAVSFLKAITLFHTRREALGSVANSLQYLADTLSSSKSLAEKLAGLAARYRAENAPGSFRALRQDTLDLLREVEESILFSDKTEKVVRMAIYNLSRYNDNGTFLQESVSRMLMQLRGDEARENFLSALEQLLEQMQLSATNEGTISVSFAENVEVKEEYVATDSLMNLGFLAETLYSTKTAEVTYTVAKGDTWSEIAEDHGLTSKELLALNPGYDMDKLRIGEILTMSASVPYLTMTVVQQERYVDSVAFDVEYTDSPDIYVGDYRVTSPGQYGAADTVANVTYVNGEETERTVLSSVTLRQPVTEHRLQGTKPKPITAASGTFRWPTTGRISSRFGGRSSPGASAPTSWISSGWTRRPASGTGGRNSTGSGPTPSPSSPPCWRRPAFRTSGPSASCPCVPPSRGNSASFLPRERKLRQYDQRDCKSNYRRRPS